MNDTFKQQFRQRLGRPLQTLGFAVGLTEFSPRLRRIRGAIVLMYHSVARQEQAAFIDPQNHVPADVFESQLAFLSQHRRVISMRQLIELTRQGQSPQPRTVVVTFDDGYLDNLTVAAPLLHRYELPATLFLPTAYIDRAETQWIDQAYSAFKFRTCSHLTVNGGDDRVFDLDEPAECEAAYRCVCNLLMTAGAQQRRALLDAVVDQLAPSQVPPRLTMTWDDVRTLTERYPRFDIGGHTVEHTDVTSTSAEQAREELRGCSSRIEANTGVRPRHFSFPYGRSSDELRAVAADAGFEAACGSTGDKLVTGTSNPMAIARVPAPPSMHRFGLLTSAANSGFWRKLGK